MSQPVTYSTEEKNEIASLNKQCTSLDSIPKNERAISVESLLINPDVRKEATVSKLGIYVHNGESVHFVGTGQYQQQLLPRESSLVRCTSGALAGVNAVVGG